MIQIFNEPPQGLQTAPHEPRIIAAGYQIAVREIDFGTVHDKDTLMLAFLKGLALRDTFGRNWDALYDVLTDPEQLNPRYALILCDYTHFKKRHPHLARELEQVLLDAQQNASEHNRSLWLLAEEPDHDPNGW
ncbi:barstar family protein [Deinococcus soli (ex Cha et al. 2016)]|uniref:barstar family protein n=1 Tax=Deinococcus soli (ex Cha et al. 2016) TaxID=1309411 RepID=UPI00166B4E95|nr:barstar family protein [Deinococcus soli (ex Cha et al. 2016)]GGB74011.1 nuclease inhibitor [Deinococcus soli (ex Cha et al. 2016)]